MRIRPLRRSARSRPSTGSMTLDMFAEVAQGTDDPDVVAFVGTKLEPVFLRNHQRDFQDVDRIQAQPFPVKRRLRIDLRGGNLEVQRRHDQFGQFALMIIHALRGFHALFPLRPDPNLCANRDYSRRRRRETRGAYPLPALTHAVRARNLVRNTCRRAIGPRIGRAEQKPSNCIRSYSAVSQSPAVPGSASSRPSMRCVRAALDWLRALSRQRNSKPASVRWRMPTCSRSVRTSVNSTVATIAWRSLASARTDSRKLCWRHGKGTEPPASACSSAPAPRGSIPPSWPIAAATRARVRCPWTFTTAARTTRTPSPGSCSPILACV